MERYLTKKLSRDRRTEPDSAPCDRAQRIDDAGAGPGFWKKSVGPSAQRTLRELFFTQERNDQDAQTGPQGFQRLDQFQGVCVIELQVENQNVWLQSLDRVSGFDGRCQLAAYREFVLFALDDAMKSLAYDRTRIEHEQFAWSLRSEIPVTRMFVTLCGHR